MRKRLLITTLVTLVACSGGGGGTADSLGGSDVWTPPDFGADTRPDIAIIVTYDIPEVADPGVADPGPDAPLADPGEDVPEDVWTPDTAGCPGASYCACEKNDDCLSGYCIATPDGMVCAAPCAADDCPSGWACRNLSVGDPIYLCIPAQPTLCFPCATDDDCGAAGYLAGALKCLDYGADVGRFCGGPCSDDDPCPTGYDCVDADGTMQCRKASGECKCPGWAKSHQLSTPCALTNDEGTCAGVRTCSAAGLSACSAATPLAETCNTTDDDCDGSTDEGLGETSCGQGPCAHSVPTCIDGEPSTCDPLQGAQPDVCNGQDDDCDGTTDQGFTDSDTDGKADCVDDDDDGDGIPDDGNGTGNPGDLPCKPGQATGCDDSCPLVANPNQEDRDLDGRGDACDPDADGDGHASLAAGGDDCEDANAAINPSQLEGSTYDAARCNGIDDDCDGQFDEGYGDADADGQADCIDADDDGDGVLDDGDGNGVAGDHPCKGGATASCDDNCPFVENADQADTNSDGLGDACASDLDGDGWPNAVDNCPDVFNPAQTNSDGKADGGDACDADDDDDGVPDATDCKPLDPAIHAGANETCDGIDNDCDGSTDEESPDSDGDKQADCVDVDDDDDGILDTKDNCKLAANFDQLDTNKDGEGDACDADDDGDGVPDASDNCPLLATADLTDTDQDGKGDPCDADDDDDGLEDGKDNCPKAANPGQEDFDGDTIGDACDPDVDGDGTPNTDDTCPVLDDKVDADGDKIPDAGEIQFAGHVWPPSTAKGKKGESFEVWVQLWKPGVTNLEGAAKDLVVKVRYQIKGAATWQEGTASYVRDFVFKDENGLEGFNEEHHFIVPASATAAGGTLVVDLVPTDLTCGEGYEHAYNNGPVQDQAWKWSLPKASSPFEYPLE